MLIRFGLVMLFSLTLAEKRYNNGGLIIMKYLVDTGTAGIWDDMNEPASFEGEIPDNIVFE